ncbi:DUF1593 domain-containing protein [Butyrivibrio sp. LC3010]|uniref:DUF1593 domain-containing protein n=1 Tax=Butyrivibrio sp. LC3010 TaxID=1280680 RepID=UPI0003FB9302|nr:DUF1593 domain-containing protein [Butyrivibrio sp. LC3010]
MGKIRTIITQDAEVDDQNSLRHFLFYANEVDVQGIIQTSSKFHWKGVPGAVKAEKKVKDDFDAGEYVENSGPFDQPYRWPGTDWMMRVIDDYEKDYPNLCKHAEGYPTPDYLRRITKVGNIGYEGEMEKPSEGSDLIKERILDDDERTLFIQVWGGTNTIARALMDIEEEYKDKDEWSVLHEKISKKVVITACGEQDPAYKEYVAEVWPGIQFVKTLQMMSYAYPWFTMPEGESKDTLKAEFMQKELLSKDSALIKGYCTWFDGHHYEGENSEGQFGSNPNILNEWFGAKFLKGEINKYDFLSEGDSPTFFVLLPFGTRTLEDFTYGGIGGRYMKVDYKNSKGVSCNVFDVAKDAYTDRDGNITEQESMWGYVADIQRDFAARVSWAAEDSYEKAEHSPLLKICEGCDISAAAGEHVTISAIAENPDKLGIDYSFRVYKEASAECANEIKPSNECISKEVLDNKAVTTEIVIPDTAVSGDKIHIIAKAASKGYYKLFDYKQIIITVK